MKQNQTNQNPIKVRTNNIIFFFEKRTNNIIDIPYTTPLENNQEPKNAIPTKQIFCYAYAVALQLVDFGFN
jgi:hypothetical protein